MKVSLRFSTPGSLRSRATSKHPPLNEVAVYKVSFVCKLLWKTTFVNFIPASQILSSHSKNYFLFWIEIPVSGFLAAFPLECNQPLLLDGSLIKPHWISDPSSTKACSKACYFSAEALLAACCLSTRAGLPWQLSQLSPAALPGALHTQCCSALTTGFLLHWGLPKLKAVSACGSFSHPLPPNPDVHRHLLLPFPRQEQGIYGQYTRMDRAQGAWSQCWTRLDTDAFGPNNNYYPKFFRFLTSGLDEQKDLFSMEGKRADVVS